MTDAAAVSAADAADDEVALEVIRIVAEQAVLDPSEVKLTSTPDELGIDSLGMVEAVFAIEEAFDVSIPFNANDPAQSEFEIENVAAIVAGVKRLIAAREA
ncbi:phosphopantetheine-binding protein [Albimonas pacifica]|uniref:Acyl carrier protein AcpXL n=1 Tax=Albimonas pacifica TaxID=1114924 RepID=A0A1I3KA02_9RHOB|nr:phosphopantetheine-binding protein [Albimonas pacifica]SFI69214.1 acyl carrier protein [Albimonas pacifica]